MRTWRRVRRWFYLLGALATLVWLGNRSGVTLLELQEQAAASPAAPVIPWVFAAVALIVAIALARIGWEAWSWAHRQVQVRRSGVDQIDRWVKRYGRARAGHMFEERGAAAHRQLGDRVENIGSHGHDLGGDLIVWDRRGVSTLEQYKLANGHKVGNRAVQEALAAMIHYGTDRARVVTNGEFTQSAYDQACAGSVVLVELYDRDATIDLLNGTPARRSS